MRLIEALPVSVGSRVAFVGAGGKSTSMFRLARQALDQGIQRVIASASTHLGVNQVKWADHHFIVEDEVDLTAIDWADLSGLVLVTGPAGQNQRTIGLPFSILTSLETIASGLGVPLLIEADGSRRLPLKAPAAHEPVIPEWVNEVVVCAGGSGLGLPLDLSTVHRPEIFSHLSGIPQGEPVTVEGLASVLLAENGGLKEIPEDARRVVNLTGVVTPELAGQAKRLSSFLLPTYDAVLASDLHQEGDEVGAVYRQVAGVVLAAGGSERLGRPKQLLDWQGKPFVRACAETALEAGLWPVLVVTGAHEEDVSQALEGLDVEIVHNKAWVEGQGGSVRAAVTALSQPAWRRVSGAMFLLSDQPQIPARLIGALLEAYSGTDAPIVAPLIDQQRGNPVLFDRAAFPDLRALEGDAGGRQVFAKFRKVTIPWHDPRDGLDVDTEEDYRRLLEDGE